MTPELRTNEPPALRLVSSVATVLALLGLTASTAHAQATVHLIAAPVTKSVTLPNGSALAVPMWGYALDANDNGSLDGTEVVSVPGPRITVPTGNTTLTIKLTNLLSEPTSVVIPGQRFVAQPVLAFEQGIVLQKFFDFLVQLERRQLQQPDRLLKLRCQRQMLRQPEL